MKYRFLMKDAGPDSFKLLALEAGLDPEKFDLSAAEKLRRDQAKTVAGKILSVVRYIPGLRFLWRQWMRSILGMNYRG